MLKKKTISAKMCFGKEFDYLDIVQKGFTKSSAMKYEPEYFQKYEMLFVVYSKPTC